MTEPSILDYASDPRLDEVMPEAGQKIQMLLSVVTELSTSLAQRRAGKAREAAAADEAGRRRFKDRQDALYEADRLVWRRAWDERFWEHATPEKIARAWEACVPWAAGGFPAARTTVDHMRAEIKERFGVDVDPMTAHGDELAGLLAAVPRTREGTAEVEPDAPGQEPDGREPLQTISYRIRDLRNDGNVVAADFVHLGRGEDARTARLIAADLLLDHQRRHGGPGREFGIEVFDGRDPESGTRLHTLDADTAPDLMARHSALLEQGREGDARAAGTPEEAAEVADALRFEQRRLRAELKETIAGRDAGEARFVVAEGRPPAERAEWIRDRIAHTGLRLQAVEADQRGEDGGLVIRSAALKREVDDRWWRQAAPDEVGALWEQVGGWPAGAARDQALDHLRAGMRREYDVELSRDTSSDRVRQVVTEGAGRRDQERRPAQPADEMEEPAASRGDRRWAEARRAAAEQDRDAAAGYERMAQQGDAEAADAAKVAGQAFPASPVARLDRTARAGSHDTGPNTPQGRDLKRNPEQER